MVAALAHLIGATVLDDSSTDRIAVALSEPFPWVEFLTVTSRREFVGEFLRTARACASVGRFERLSVVVANWRETAIARSLGLGETIAGLDYINDGGVAAEDPRAR